MAIEYERVNWDTTKYVNPTNMNQMDAGIKAACDGVDENSSAISAINSTLQNLKWGSLETVGTLNNTSNTLTCNKSGMLKAYINPSTTNGAYCRFSVGSDPYSVECKGGSAGVNVAPINAGEVIKLVVLTGTTEVQFTMRPLTFD